MRDDLSSLIERIEKSEGADSALDREIMFALGYRYEQRHIGAFYDDNEPALDWVFVDPVTNKWVSTHPRDFTSSLDAVLTLVESDAFWRVGNDGAGADPSLFKAEMLRPMLHRLPYTAVADTPALALCAAALKARSQYHEG